uniref:DUF768 domain-containing protein n=1 Tax=Angiostrongylus cantonensis TaxID=6313 RepID=A0A0K0DFI9_ANGCA
MFGLVRQPGITEATSDHYVTSELAKQCGEAIKENLKERGGAVMVEAAAAADARLVQVSVAAVDVAVGVVGRWLTYR